MRQRQQQQDSAVFPREFFSEKTPTPRPPFSRAVLPPKCERERACVCVRRPSAAAPQRAPGFCPGVPHSSVFVATPVSIIIDLLSRPPGARRQTTTTAGFVSAGGAQQQFLPPQQQQQQLGLAAVTNSSASPRNNNSQQQQHLHQLQQTNSRLDNNQGSFR